MIANFPNYTSISAYTDNKSNLDRMSFWRDWLPSHDIHTILELGRANGYGSTWFFVESGCEVWSVDVSDETGLIIDPKGLRKSDGQGFDGGFPSNVKVGDGIDSWRFNAVELKKYPNFHMLVADDRQPILEIDNKKFDLVFLDTSHTYEHTRYELQRYYPMATKWFAVDDYHWGNTLDRGVNGACVWAEMCGITGHFEFIGGNDVYAVKKA